MNIWKLLFKKKFFWMGILIPLVFQLVYFCIAIPAIKDGNTGISNLKIVIVNEDQILGNEIAAKLSEVLPFKTEVTADFSNSMDVMNNGDCNMVIHIPSDFTSKCHNGTAQISYYINQAAPSMTKQAMEKIATSINQILNENSFEAIKETLKQSTGTALSQSGLPESTLQQISTRLSQALDSLKYTTISSDVQKVNNAEGFTQTVLPFFIFLTYFVGCILMTVLHTLVFKGLEKNYSRGKIFLVRLGVNILVALIIPCIIVGIAAGFNISFSTDLLAVWSLLSLGFFTLLYLIQMFSQWFGIPGMGVAAVVLFPLQLISSGLIYSREILPVFYTVVRDYLPSSYFGAGMIKIFYGGPAVSKEISILLLMSAVFVLVSSATLLIKQKSEIAEADEKVTKPV